MQWKIFSMPIDEVVGELSESELRALVPQLQSLTKKYKRSELVQKALYRISELSSSVDNYDSLFCEIHKIIAEFMTADNFFIAFFNKREEKIEFDYFVDERDEQTIQSVPYETLKHGITAHILRSGRTLVLTKENCEALSQQHNFQILGTPPVDLMGVPIIRENEVIGVMTVQSYTDEVRYDALDLEILIFISQHIVTARDRVIQRDVNESIIAQRTDELVAANKTLEEEIKQRTRMEKLQKALFEISELSSAVERDMLAFYTRLHNILMPLINAKYCYVALINDAEESISFPYFIGRDSDFHSTRKLTRGLTEYIIRSGEAYLVDKSKIDELVNNGEVERKFVTQMIELNNSWMGAPLVVDGKVKGVIAVQTYGEGRDYNNSDLELLQFVSRHISTAIQRRDTTHALRTYNQQLTEKVQERTSELNKSNQTLKRQIEQRKEIELQLIYDAHHDDLTNLPNRVMFNSRLELAIASKKRYAQHNFALLFIDLDRFKNINDTLGHYAGDEFLIEVSKRIGACKRNHDLLARLGGDEFVLLLDHYHNMDDVEAIAQRIVSSVSAPFSIDGKEVFSSASIGITEISADYEQADEALRDADVAMYHAKNLGRNRYIVFNLNMRKHLMNEIGDESAFRQAYQLGDFHYTLEPICSLDSDNVLYYECGIAWAHNDKCKTPEAFWELADKCGLTFAINYDLMQETFKLLERFRVDPAMKDTKIGVSLSIEYLLHTASFESLIGHIESSKMNSQLLVIQLSEHSLSRFNKYLPAVLQKLQNLGANIVLNNFASHSASLTNLFKHDFDYIKLNANLVNTFAMSDKYYRLVKSIILIADEMGIGVIGDGIKDEMIRQDLIEIGCHFGQGTLIKAPDKH